MTYRMCVCGHSEGKHGPSPADTDGRLCHECDCDIVKIDHDYEFEMEFLIGPPPHLRCECGWIYNFHHKTRLIEVSLMTDIQLSHLSSPEHKEKRA